MLFSLVFALRGLICVSRFLTGVSRLTCLKKAISINFGGIKDVYLAETVQNTCSFNHSWQRQGDPAGDLQAGKVPSREPSAQEKAGTLLLLASSGTWLHLSLPDTTQMPQSFSARGLQSACGFSLEGWTVGRELPAPCQSMGTASI